jgi:hypothetical protein
MDKACCKTNNNSIAIVAGRGCESVNIVMVLLPGRQTTKI